jgi:uncharacterized protein (DUF58 family)
MLYPDFDDLVALKDSKSRMHHPSHLAVRSIVAGGHRSPLRGQGLEFDSVREYVIGDDIRNIDWRVTARMGSPHLKIFREERERHILICVDMNSTMRFGTRNTFKSVQAARIAALLGWQGVAHHDRVSACLYGDVPGGMHRLAPTRSWKSLGSLFKVLATPPVEHHAVSLEKILPQISQAAPTGSLIYFISDFMETDQHLQQSAAMHRLKKSCDLVFIAVNDPADQAISPVGLLGFCADSSTAGIVVNTSSQAGREAYAQQWQKNREWLHGVTSKLQIPLIELTTESDLQQELAIGLKRIGRRRKR